MNAQPAGFSWDALRAMFELERKASPPIGQALPKEAVTKITEQALGIKK